MSKKVLRIGAHMSIAGGPQNALIDGEKIGCTTLQMFTRSNRQWLFNTFDTQTAEAFRQKHQETNIDPLVCHAIYLINLASTDKAIHTKSMRCLEADIISCHQLGIPYIVLHPGSYRDADIDTGIQAVTQNLNTIISNTPDDVMILLETMAGQGTAIGSRFEDLALIREKVHKPERIGICFDTCHAFAAGYHFSTEESYHIMWDAFDEIIGLDQLKIMHMNDSKKEYGSRKDRHEHIGKGEIPIESFTLLMNDERFFDIPKILETPNGLEDDIANMQKLESLLNNTSKRELHIPSHNVQ